MLENRKLIKAEMLESGLEKCPILEEKIICIYYIFINR